MWPVPFRMLISTRACSLNRGRTYANEFRPGSPEPPSAVFTGGGVGQVCHRVCLTVAEPDGAQFGRVTFQKESRHVMDNLQLCLIFLDYFSPFFL